ncbi:uncharacterized protein si:dkey-74k8.3 isoform X1 [Thalassophryne amazonica]|uniref:uncharacterized protein si:dkey-74k8.3 isoform X1 n=1 Tax=Thalassophryne amazonica TaxID=390379 RepID=UPI00147158AB|nr:uncharacterized protein si:dkey-74k8.3 isoform X1 [Thalassophryne amazonica]
MCCSGSGSGHLVLVLVALAAGCVVAEQQTEPSAQRPPAVTLRNLISGTCQEVQRVAESVLGSAVVRSAVEFVQMVIRFFAEGAASGLNVIAVYVTEILRVTGCDVALTLPRFTPEGVTAVAQWGLLSLIGYWVLTLVLRLLFGVMRQVFWVVKTVLALWLFGLIVADSSALADITAVRLAGLVLGCVLLSLLTGGSEKAVTVESRLGYLEDRLKAMERRKGGQ